MAKILVGYEWGLGMGHLARMLPVARTLSARDHQVVFFLYNPSECARAFAAEQLPVIPVMRIFARIPEMGTVPRFNSYSDVISSICGYYQENLFMVTLSWKTIFDIYKPDLIVCDHSPCCCLAAFGRIPVVLMGDGFTLPPAHEPDFPVYCGESPALDTEQLLENMRFVQKMHGQKVPQTITEPFRAAARLFCTLPELDHYQMMRRDTVIGPPPNDLYEPIAPPVESRWFAYLKAAYPVTGKIIEYLCGIKLPGEVYISDITPENAERLTRNNIVVHNVPPPMDQILPRVSVVLHHGGNGVACAALSAGRPQIVIPMYQETELTAERLRRIGVGYVAFPQDVQLVDVGTLISEAVENRVMMFRAQTAARNIQARGPSRSLETCMEACEKVLSG